MSSGGGTFEIGERIGWAHRGERHRRAPDDPAFRRLRIFVVDPAASRVDGAVAEVPVPFEPLRPGPAGSLFVVVDRDDSVRGADRRPVTYRPIDLDAPRLLITAGADPSPTDWESHQQMVYAVAMRLYHAFRRALGRDPTWAFDRPYLAMRPHGVRERNAWYDRDAKEVVFGYFRTGEGGDRRGAAGPEEWIFTCLSHDVVAHELGHALLDGMRTAFFEPTGRDVLGFHEGFSDIVALLHRFEHRELLRGAIAQVRGRLSGRSVLTSIARQFGEAVGLEGALRHAVGALEGGFEKPATYASDLEEHDLGEILLSAVFEAFERIYRRRTAALFRLATGGSGITGPGALSHDLVESLTESAGAIARQFLDICIRAIDYCPPVDIELGEYLRALITADSDIVPDDPWGYRETMVDTFRRRRIYPRGVPTLSEDALRWRPPQLEDARIRGLEFGELRFGDDPGRAASTEELLRQARLLGDFACDPRRSAAFGLERPGGHGGGLAVGLPVVESIRAARRVSPDGTVGFDLVGEILQEATLTLRSGGRRRRIAVHGGATIIVGADGRVRYAIAKRVGNRERLRRQAEFAIAAMRRGSGLWEADERGTLRPSRSPLRALHARRFAASSEGPK
ncbi:MAG TPA: hypothetical protein PKC43_10725 [Phycisphaerales bacterium]|nr:hypothetical protein [Phycisphaerales bacterium]HMP37909.1 hypothetical protein [Phycisphaerales bacterium]